MMGEKRKALRVYMYTCQSDRLQFGMQRYLDPLPAYRVGSR